MEKNVPDQNNRKLYQNPVAKTKLAHLVSPFGYTIFAYNLETKEQVRPKTSLSFCRAPNSGKLHKLILQVTSSSNGARVRSFFFSEHHVYSITRRAIYPTLYMHIWPFNTRDKVPEEAVTAVEVKDTF